MDVEAIVNGANIDLAAGGVICGTIFRVAFLSRCRKGNNL